MKTLASCLLMTACLVARGWAGPLDIVGEDSADQGVYASEWATGKNSGNGFGKWTLQTSTEPNSESYAGFYIAGTVDHPDLKDAAMENKAFGLYANGAGFESATAFRPFSHPLKVGQSFSFLMEHGDIVKKYATDDPSGGGIGLTLRATTASASTEDYNKEARFEIGYYKPGSAYVIHDGDGSKSLDVQLAEGGMEVTFTLVTADTYNLEILMLGSRQIVHLAGRHLAGNAGAPIASFCLFDRNGEANDAYFNGFQILQEAQ